MTILVNDNFLDNQVIGQKLYPIGSDPDMSAVVAQNVKIVNGKLNFTLKVEEGFAKDYQTFRIVNLSQKDLLGLKEEDFPFSMGNQTSKIIFDKSDNSRNYKLDHGNNIVSIDYGRSSTGRLLVVFLNQPERLSEIFLLSLNSTNVRVENNNKIKQKIKVTKRNDLYFDSLKNTTFVSNLLFSYSADKNVSGFFCVDKDVLANYYAAFPNLIKMSGMDMFDKFLYKIELKFRRYDKSKNGYSIAQDKDINVGEIKPVNNLIVKNSNGKRFYNFRQKAFDTISEYQGSIALFLNDVSIGMAKSKLLELNTVKKEQDREGLKIFVAELYGTSVPSSVNRLLRNIDVISASDFNSLILLIKKDVENKINLASQKTNANQHVASQYFSPKPFFANFYSPKVENRFKGKITFKGYKNNSFLTLEEGEIFKQKQSTDFNPFIEPAIVLNTKTFVKAKTIEPIKAFNIFSKKDIQAVQGGLNNRADCGIEDFIADEKISVPKKPQQLTLSTVSEIKQDVYYLDSVNDTAAGLVFKKVEDNTLPTLEIGEKLLLRINNYNEYYDSYFYLVNDLG